MGVRTFSGCYYSNKILADEDELIFSSGLDFDPAVNNNSLTCTGGDIVITNTRGYCSSFYLDIYIDGEYACATKEKNDKNEDTHDMTLYIDTEDSIDESVLFNNSGNIKIVAKNNNGSGNVIGLRGSSSGESEITVRAYYEDPLYFTAHPSNLKINNTSSYTGRTASLTWSAASLSNGGSIRYSIRKNGAEVASVTDTTSCTISETTTSTWGTSAVTLTVVATGSGLTSNATNGVTYTYKPAFTTNPSNLKINNTTSYTGQTASLTWSAAALSNSSSITYSIRKNGTQVATTSSTSYSFPESTTSDWGTSAVTLTVVATGSGLTSSATNGVSYTYKPVFTANPSNLLVNNSSSYIGQTAPLTWSAASISNNASIKYSIRKNGAEIANVTDTTSYTILESTTSTWGETAVTLTVVANSTGITSTASNGVTYTYKPPYTNIGNPSGLSVDETGVTSAYVKKNSSFTLKWTAAENGVNNAVTSYTIYKDGEQYLTNITEIQTTISTSSLTAGKKYTFTVQAIGEKNNSNNSNEVSVSIYTDPQAPKSIFISDSTPDLNSNVTIYWDEAASGSYNSITGYKIYESTSVDGQYRLFAEITNNDIIGEYTFKVPSNANGSYYYKISTVGARSESAMSEQYVNYTIMVYTACTAPTVFNLEKTLTNGQATTLYWSGAEGGTNNNIKNYLIEQSESSDGLIWDNFTQLTLVSGDITSTTVYPPTEDGHYYKYRIQVQGELENEEYYSEWKDCSNYLQKYDTEGIDFTDAILTSGLTRVKAIHMIELQNKINEIRVASDIEEYAFTKIESGITSLGGWTSHVTELRKAIEDIVSYTIEWEEIEKNIPRVSIIEQIRTIVKNL